MAAVVIVIIVIVAGVVGFKMLGSKSGASTASDSSSKAKMQDYQNQIQQQHGASSAGHAPGGAPRGPGG